MNTYALAEQLQGLSGHESVSVSDALMAIEAASREVEQLCGRVFWTQSATRHFDVPARCGDDVAIDDLLSATAITSDWDSDGTYLDTLTEGTHVELLPQHAWPKQRLRVLPWSDETVVSGVRTLRIAGVWGYGDGQSATPWRAVTGTATVASTTGETLTLSGGHGVKAGMTLLVGSEQMHVSATASTSATVRRAVNGTTASTHSGASIQSAQYPAGIARAVLWLAAESRNMMARGGVIEQRIGAYSEKLTAIPMNHRRAMVAGYRR